MVSVVWINRNEEKYVARRKRKINMFVVQKWFYQIRECSRRRATGKEFVAITVRNRKKL